MAYLSKNIAFSWNKTQLLIAETYGYQKWYHDVLLLLHSGALWRDREVGVGGPLFLEMKASKQRIIWRTSDARLRAPNSGLQQKPSSRRVQFCKCQRWVERSKDSWWRAGGQISRWTAHGWLAVPVARPDSVAVDLLHQLLEVGRESQKGKEWEPMPEKTFVKMLSSICLWQGEGQVGVPWGKNNHWADKLFWGFTSTPFYAFSSLDGIFLLCQSLNAELSYSFILLVSHTSLKYDTGLESFQLTHSKNKWLEMFNW